MPEYLAHQGNTQNSRTFSIHRVDGEVEEQIGYSMGIATRNGGLVLELRGQKFANVSQVPTPVLKTWPLTSVLSYWEV